MGSCFMFLGWENKKNYDMKVGRFVGRIMDFSEARY